MEIKIRTVLIMVLYLIFLIACKMNEKALGDIRKPNIIFIMADDLGYGDIGVYGQQVIPTPNIDQLAAEGMRFSQCYAGSTVCAPSRSVLMTGQHTGHTTVRGNNGIGGVVGLGGAPGRIPLEENDTTIAEVLKDAGYYTGMVGKWGLGEPNTSGEPLRQGFDEFYGFLNQRRAHSYYPEYIWHNNDKVRLKGNMDGQKTEYIHTKFMDYTIDFLDRHQDTAFFLYLPFTLTHDEYEITSPHAYIDSLQWTEEERIYAAMTSLLDESVEEIMKKLHALGIDKNTLVFFCSDNGAARRWEGRFDSSGSLRGRKRDLYEGGIRTPMIVRYPGMIKAGTQSDTPWYFADVLPTLAALSGAKIPHQIDGKNMLPSFGLSPDTLPGKERVFYWEFYEGGFQQAIRMGMWKAVKPYTEKPWELYNLETDLSESLDVSSKHQDIVDKIKVIADREHIPSPYFVVPADKEEEKLE